MRKPNLTFSDIADDYSSVTTNFTDIIDDCSKWLGLAISNQINFLVPDEVILSGKIFKLGNKFHKKVIAKIKEFTFPAFIKETKIRKSENWDESASAGAASLFIRKVFENFESIK